MNTYCDEKDCKFLLRYQDARCNGDYGINYIEEYFIDVYLALKRFFETDKNSLNPVLYTRDVDGALDLIVVGNE